MSTRDDEMLGLRDGRKPGHFWVDNEAVDVFQPIIGADALWVYCRIARYAIGGAWIVSPSARRGDTRVGLREMAEWCGKSPDTVWRCLQLLEHVGLVAAHPGARAKGRYALADVKDLIAREGGAYDRGAGMMRLPAARVVALQAEVAELKKRLARKAPSAAQTAAQTVALSDTSADLDFSAPAAECDSYVAVSDASVALGGVPSSSSKDCKDESTTSPLPPQVGADAADVCKVVSIAAAKTTAVELTSEQREHVDAQSGGMRANWIAFYVQQNREAAEKQAAAERDERERAELDALHRRAMPTMECAVAWAMRECGFVEDRPGRGMSRVLRAVIESEVCAGARWYITAPRMVAAWRKWIANRQHMTAKYGAKNFFREGLWRDERAWPWNEARLTLAREASAGAR